MVCDKCQGNVTASPTQKNCVVCENCKTEYPMGWVRMKCGLPVTYLIEEAAEHEGTWFIWPHEYHLAKTKSEGKELLNRIEWIWIKIVEALCADEHVHIIAYDESTQKRILKLLQGRNISLDGIDFVIAKTDSFWVRDTGPIFGIDNYGNAVILNFEFDSWGKKTDKGELLYQNDNRLPFEIAKAKGFPFLDIPDFPGKKFVLEGGAYDYDGYGTLMACKSSVISAHRNADFTVEEAALYFLQYFGVEPENIIWLNGELDQMDHHACHSDITDCHIDGLARFYDKNTVISLPKEYFPENDYHRLCKAFNSDGQKYRIINLPIETNDEWVYINYYIGNSSLIVPTLSCVNIKVLNTLSELYPSKKIIPIDVTELVKYGGAIHCITQQQPKTASDTEQAKETATCE